MDDILEIAKRGAYETGQFDGLTERDFNEEINTRVEGIRKSGESFASAYLRFATIPEVQALFAAANVAPKGPATGVAKARRAESEDGDDRPAPRKARQESDEPNDDVDEEELHDMAKIVSKALKIVTVDEAKTIIKHAPGRFREVIEKAGIPIGSGNAMAKLQAQADELRKADPFLSPEMAFAKIYSDPANAKLANAERHSTYSRMYGTR